MAVDETGSILWQRDYGGIGSEDPQKIVTLDDSSFYLLNFSNSEVSGDVQEDCLNFYEDGDFNYTGDAWIVKLKNGYVPCAANAGFGISHKCTDFLFHNTSYFATSYLWDFGDGTTSTDFNPNHSYATNGQYNVCLNRKRLLRF
jgi:hypothetical protein